MKKSQVSTEFMVFVGMSIVLLMVYMVIANNFLNIAYTQQEITSAQDLAKILKNEINLASRVENGYIKEFQLPPEIDNKDYFIDIPPSAREIEISYKDSIYTEGADFTEMLSTEVDSDPLISGNTILIQKIDNDVIITIKPP
ncbi:MAG: hypothetical protein KJ674_01385 [Nanoarchaeota archaeon]|nr:hypothetical protein [Nanoarchaeota archaeon]